MAVRSRCARSGTRARRRADDRSAATGRQQRNDGGRAIIEVVFLAVLLLIPVLYIMIGLLRLQSATVAVAQAARDAGRVIETRGYSADVDLVARTDLRDQGLATDQMSVKAVASGADCQGGSAFSPSYVPGETFDLCVIAVVSLPGVPTVISGSNNTVTGVYTVHIGELREGR